VEDKDHGRPPRNVERPKMKNPLIRLKELVNG